MYKKPIAVWVINGDTLDFIEKVEPFHSTAKKHLNGGYSLGYGSTLGVQKGDKITYEEAEVKLTKDLYVYKNFLKDIISIPISFRQATAIYSLVHHIGITAFLNTPIPKLLNKGLFSDVGKELLKLTFGNKVKVIKRRRLEYGMFMQGEDDWIEDFD